MEHCCHEARGLDVLPTTVSRFRWADWGLRAASSSNWIGPGLSTPPPRGQPSHTISDAWPVGGAFSCACAQLLRHHECACSKGLRCIRRFNRRNGDAASADLLERVIYAEEISHCGAGVRWLHHLHQLAHFDAAWPGNEQQQQQEQYARAGQGQDTLASDSADRSANAPTSAPAPAVQAAASTPAAAAQAAPQAPSGMPAWAAEARQHATVETWFHALIRRHFRGPLKPPFNDAARAKAGFGPEWYLPLAAVQAPAPAAAAAAVAGA